MFKSSIKVIFFDIGNTLFNNDVFDSAGIKEVIKEIIRIYKLKTTISRNLPLFKKAIAKSSVHLANNKEFTLAKRNDPEKMYQMIIQGWCRELIKLMGENPAVKTVNLTFNSFIHGGSKSDSIFPGVEETLFSLRETYDLGIISNALSANARGILKHSGINRLFKVVVISGEVGVEKPDPAIFNLALKKAKVKPSEALMVGDDLERDILGAAEVGMATVWIKGIHQKVVKDFRPNYTIKRISELQSFICPKMGGVVKYKL